MQQVRKPISVCLVLGCLWAAGCGEKSPPGEPLTTNITWQAPPARTEDGKLAAIPQLAATGDEKGSAFVPNENANFFPEVLIRTTLGDIKVRLNAEKARLTVDNFLEQYVDNGFYAGTVFHHVDSGFMVIGGGYTQDGTASTCADTQRSV